MRISKKYGVNPSMDTCVICGHETNIILFGTSYKDENGKTAEAPMRICTGNSICDECKAVLDEGGVFFIEVRDGSDNKNPYRTGRLWGIKGEAADRIFHEHKNINYIEESAAKQIFDEQ